MSELENGHAIGAFASWEIESETIAVKQCDKIVFEHHGSAVPRELCWFFRADSLEAGKKRSITLRYGGRKYDA